MELPFGIQELGVLHRLLLGRILPGPFPMVLKPLHPLDDQESFAFDRMFKYLPELNREKESG